VLIVIEGVDGSGKQTHTENVYNMLLEENIPARKIHFPVYESESSSLVKMYLSGAFGERAEDVNPYASSSFYAVDRIASYLSDWKSDYQNGKVVISDRYTTSNAIHQASKLEGAEQDKYLNWLFDYEYNLCGLPAPDAVIFLDMPPQYGEKLISNRSNKATGETEKDIHEKDKNHILTSYNTAKKIADKFGWKIIKCVKDGKIRTIDEISNEIFDFIRGL